MILVTLGTQDKSFVRLLDAVQEQIEKGNIKDSVFVQTGHTKYKSNDMKIFDMLPIDEFNKLLDESSLIITHGGAGSIIIALMKGKKVIAAPRLAKYKEHINDHQKQIVDRLSKDGYILSLNDDLSNFENVLKSVSSFKPKKYQSNVDNMISLVEKLIDL